MPIISLSISDALAKDIATFAKQGKVGKSEFARAALSSYIDTHYAKVLVAGQTYTASLSILCSETHKHTVHELMHGVSVRSQFHLCLGRERCIEVFGVTARGSELLPILKQLETLPKVEKMQLCLDK